MLEFDQMQQAQSSPKQPHDPVAGMTVRDVARRLRVSPRKVAIWIRKGELRATNTAHTLSARPRWIISAEALAEFEKGRSGGPTPQAPKRRPRLAIVDFYP